MTNGNLGGLVKFFYFLVGKKVTAGKPVAVGIHSESGGGGRG